MTVILPSCGGYINNPAPVTTSLSPSHLSAGNPQFTLTVNGKNLTPSSQVLWSGLATNQQPIAILTSFLSESQLQAQIPANFVQVPGSAQITVFTAQPGGGTSQPPLTFTIDPVASPIPHITSVSPAGVLAGSTGFNLIVTGKNFVATSVGTVNGAHRPTTFTNSTSLQMTLITADLANAATLQIAVINPPPDGGTSDPFPFSVRNPVPLISSLIPNSVTAGGTPTTLVVTGTGMVNGSQILINGSPRTTATLSATQVSTQLTAGDLGVGGVNQVQVSNPGPGGGPSNILTFAVNPTTTIGLPIILDLAPDGTLADNGVCGNNCIGGVPNQTTAGPSTAEDGSLVAYASISANLVAGNKNTNSDVYLSKTCLGGSGCTPLTILLSTDQFGNSANGASTEPVLSNSGSDIAFTSTATNLDTSVPQNGTTRQVFFRSTCTTTPTCVGTGLQTQIVSVSADGTAAGNGDSFNPAISSDGRFVAFVSRATNLVSNITFDGVAPQVFVRDTCSGTVSGTCTPTTFLISVAPDGITPGDGASANPSIATSGLFVSFTSTAKNLGPTAPNPSGLSEVFLRGCTYSTSACAGQNLLVSTPDGVTPANGASSQSAITPSGRFIAFASTATNLGVNTGGVQQVFVRDTCLGIASGCTASNHLVSTPNGTTVGNATSERPSVNDAALNGADLLISFASLASNLSANTANGVENAFVRETCLNTTTNCGPGTIVASQPAGVAPAPSNGSSLAPSISADGHSVSFLSFSNNLVAIPTNGLLNVFLAGTTF